MAEYLKEIKARISSVSVDVLIKNTKWKLNTTLMAYDTILLAEIENIAKNFNSLLLMRKGKLMWLKVR